MGRVMTVKVIAHYLATRLTSRTPEANPLARKPLPRSGRGSELGAAYRNRTDDLRITRGLFPGRAPASCTDSTDRRRLSCSYLGRMNCPDVGPDLPDMSASWPAAVSP